jgi:hypothetical protein
MKRLVLFAVVALAGFANAQDKFDGCGLGWQVTDKKTYLATTTRATTNAVVPPTFGMTSGTIGCDRFEGFAANEKQNAEYVAKNFEAIRSELAVGAGEYVDATAQSFNCDSKSFGSHIQQNYNTVVTPAQDGIELYNNLKAAAAAVCS